MVIHFYVKQSIFITGPNHNKNVLEYKPHTSSRRICFAKYFGNSIFEVDRQVINVSRILIQLNELFYLP